ncbi:MAG: hypothetical protein ACE5IK_09010, partial [Acidobacteriota bacterium]
MTNRPTLELDDANVLVLGRDDETDLILARSLAASSGHHPDNTVEHHITSQCQVLRLVVSVLTGPVWP